jgi:hypothetical protein
MFDGSAPVRDPCVRHHHCLQQTRAPGSPTGRLLHSTSVARVGVQVAPGPVRLFAHGTMGAACCAAAEIGDVL